MPYVNVHVDIDDILDDIPTEVLRRELASRAGSGETAPMTGTDAKLSLDNAAMQLRKVGRNDLAFRLDEIRTDYFQ